MYLRHSFIAIAGFLALSIPIVESSASSQDHAVDLPANIEGQYSVMGTNPNGDRYSGSLQVFTRGKVYEFRWNAGRQYNGIGVKNGRTVAVAFANGSDGSGCGVVDEVDYLKHHASEQLRTRSGLRVTQAVGDAYARSTPSGISIQTNALPCLPPKLHRCSSTRSQTSDGGIPIQFSR